MEVDVPDVPEVTIPHLPFILSIPRSKSMEPGNAIAWHQKVILCVITLSPYRRGISASHALMCSQSAFSGQCSNNIS